MQTVQTFTSSALSGPPAHLRPRRQPVATTSDSSTWMKNALSIIALVGLITVFAIPGPWWVAVILFALMLAPHVKAGQAVEDQRRRHLLV